MPRRVLVAVNERKPDAARAAIRVEELAKSRGVFAGRFSVPCDCVPVDAAEIDLVIVIGGDGTLLAAARCFIGTGVPLLGVNAGRVGFMSAFDIEAMDDNADAIFGDAPLQTRRIPTLQGRVTTADAKHTIAGVNEIVVTAGPPYRMVTLDLSINGQPGPTVTGDGLIVSSPTGSTAYNVSAGGPILAPGLDAVVITPIAAHSLAFRPIVVPASATIDITITRGNDNGDTGTAVVADGQVTRRLSTGDHVSITGNGPPVSFVVNEDTNYWQTLMRKMRWAQPPASRADR